MAAEPTDQDLFALAETLLSGIDTHIRSDTAFIREAVLEHRELWALLYTAHHGETDSETRSPQA